MSSPRASTEHAKPSPRAYVHIYLKPKCLCPGMPSPRAYTMIPMKAGLPVQCQAYHGVLFKEDCMIYHASDCFLHFCHNLQACKASAHLLVWAAYCYYVARLISCPFNPWASHHSQHVPLAVFSIPLANFHVNHAVLAPMEIECWLCPTPLVYQWHGRWARV